jgi:hypothetical protein
MNLLAYSIPQKNTAVADDRFAQEFNGRNTANQNQVRIYACML